MAGRTASSEVGSAMMIRYVGYQMTAREQQVANFREAEALEDRIYDIIDGDSKHILPIYMRQYKS